MKRTFITETHMVSNAPIRMAHGDKDRNHHLPFGIAVEASQLPYQCHHEIAEVWR